MERDDHFTKAFYELPVSGFPVKVGEMDGSQPYTLGQGDILIIGPGESHCIFPSSHEARRVCVMFEPGLLFLKTVLLHTGRAFLKSPSTARTGRRIPG